MKSKSNTMVKKVPTSTRVPAFDILRGLMLVIMLVDHIELYPSLYDLFSGRGRLFVSAAEGFFFLSGLLVGMVYRRRIALGMRFIFTKMWTRAAELYVLSVATTLGYAYWAISVDKPGIKYGLIQPIDWSHIIEQTLLLRYGFGWADFLARFAILMFIAPFAFYLLYKGWWRILLILSLGVWIFRGQNFTMAWQLLFLGGMITGYYWHEIEKYVNGLKKSTQIRVKRGLMVTAGITFFVSYLGVYLLSFLNERPDSLPWSVTTFIGHINQVNEYVWLYAEKWTLGPLRISLFMIWFSALFLIIQKHHMRINQTTHGVLDLLGRNSLFVYMLHAFIVFVFHLYIPSGTTLVQNFLITTAALVALIAGTELYRKSRQSFPNITVAKFYNRIGSSTTSLKTRLLGRSA